MSIIDPASLSTHAKAVADADEQLVKDGYGRLELAIAAIANADGVSETDRAAALEKLASNASKLVRSLASAASVEEAITAVFGSAGSSPAGALGTPNTDVARDLFDFTKNEFGGIDERDALARALVAKGVIGGSVPIAGNQVKAVADLSEANRLKDTAEANLVTANTQKDVAVRVVQARDAAIASIKAAVRPARVGNDKVIEISKLSPEAKSALGL